MKHITATQARRTWFQVLDEIVDGEVVVVERRGRRIVLQVEPGSLASDPVPDYAGLISGPALDGADLWGWEWQPENDGLERPPSA